MSRVAVVKCGAYNLKPLEESIQTAVNYLGGIKKFVKSGEKVLIKPNLLSARNSEDAVTTHPEFLRAVIRLVKREGGIPVVGDSPSTAFEGVEKVWIETGIKTVCDEEDVELVSFEAGGSVEIKSKNPNNKNIPVLHISKIPLESKTIISLPKLKTHNLMLLTGAVKNMYGCVPGFRKAEYHKMAVNPSNFAELLADILSIVKPQLTIVDGITVMEGNGPSAGKVRDLGLVISGEDPVAIDSVMAKIMGLNPDDVPSTVSSARLGLGEKELSKIEVIGETIESLKLKKFEIPTNFLMKLIPQFLVDIFGDLIEVRPFINGGICTNCQTCVKCCPNKTIIPKEKFPVIDYKNCINCYCCSEVCPEKAVIMKKSFLVKLLIK